MRKLKKIWILGIIVTCGVFVLSCSQKKQDDTLTIADQFGLPYAPLEIMKHQEFLEQELKSAGLEDIKIEWIKLPNTSAIREAMLSNSLDVGFVGIPPFLLGLDNGMEWKIISALSESNVALVTKDDSVKSLTDLSEQHRIILPQPGSIQHILLQMALDRLELDPVIFDNQLVSLSHPDGVIAFSTGDESQLHFTTPPYLQEDLNVSGTRVLIDGKQCFGDDFTFIVGICEQDFYEDDEKYKCFRNALQRSIDFMNQNPEEAIQILSRAYDYDVEALTVYLDATQTKFDTEVRGLENFIEFMVKMGQIKQTYETEDLFWEKP